MNLIRPNKHRILIVLAFFVASTLAGAVHAAVMDSVAGDSMHSMAGTDGYPSRVSGCAQATGDGSDAPVGESNTACPDRCTAALTGTIDSRRESLPDSTPGDTWLTAYYATPLGMRLTPPDRPPRN